MNKKYQNFINKKKEDWQYYSALTSKRIKKPITILLGPNGTGKSMSLRSIKCELKDKDIKTLSYSTSKDDIVQKGAPAFGNWDISKLAMAFSSEGERMISSFLDWCNTDLLKEVLSHKEPLWLLIDEADSGLSVDRLVFTLTQFLFVVVSEIEKGRDINAILTCNSYEMLEPFLSEKLKDFVDIIWVPTKESIRPNNYEHFKKPYKEYYELYVSQED